MRLRERGVALTKVARALGKDPSTVSRVNQRQRRSREIEEAIAERLGLSVRDAFPEWHRRSRTSILAPRNRPARTSASLTSACQRGGSHPTPHTAASITWRRYARSNGFVR